MQASDPGGGSSHASKRVARMGRPLFRVVGPVAVGVLLAWLVVPRAKPRPDVLLVTIDTLRADALGDEDMPALAGLATGGRRYLAMRTPVPLTLPAHVSLLTGLAPGGHGVRDNTARPLPPREQRSFTLLAEEFSDAGYSTAAFVASSVLDPRYRLDAGFDQYRHPERHERGALAFGTLDGAEQVRRFADWWRNRPGDRPAFVWVHLWDPHDPYRPYEGDARRAGTAEQDAPALRYRGETRRVDHALERILALVDRATTLVVVTSDHGESLGEHGERTHGYLCYGATMDVPLVLAGPGIDPGSDDRPCSLVDLAPTLRARCGLESREGDGKDLLGARGEERVIAGESLYAYRLFRWAQQQVAFDGRFSLLDAGPELSIFELDADPGELRPLFEPTAHPAYERLDRALIAARRAQAAPGEGETYAPTDTPYGSKRIAGNLLLAPRENRKLPEVRPRLDQVAILDRFKGLILARQAAALRRLLPRIEALEAGDATNPALPLHRGRALLFVLHEPAAAAEAIGKAVRLGYVDEDVQAMLAEARRQARGG